MRRFQHKETGRIVRVLEVFEKSGTMLVEFEDDGTSKSFSPSTMKRWWKELTEEETGTKVVEKKSTETVKKEKPVKKSEEVAGDGTSYKQVMKEILADEKLAVEKKAKKDKSTSTNKEAVCVPKLLTYIEKSANKIKVTGYIRDKQPNTINYKGTKSVLFIVHRLQKGVQIFAKSKTLPKEYWSSFDSIGGFFDRRLTITEFNDDSKLLIDNIINALKEEQK